MTNLGRCHYFCMTAFWNYLPSVVLKYIIFIYNYILSKYCMHILKSTNDKLGFPLRRVGEVGLAAAE